MKRPVILITGFGGFPGAPSNPTETLMQSLAVHEALLAELGVKLERYMLPVIYDEIASQLESLIAEISPDAILHFGLAARRRAISIETRAVNRLSSLRPDAAGRFAETSEVLPGDKDFLRHASVPTRELHAALRDAGVASRLSIDAGDYVCNQTFYMSLAMAAGTDRMVGFIHVPKWGSAELEEAASVLIMALLPHLRRQTTSLHT